MESLKDIMKDKLKSTNFDLETNFDEKISSNYMFNKLVTSLKLPKEYLMKYTSSLCDSANELNNCKNCQNILECSNSVKGYVYYPEYLNDNLVFNYVPCKYKKKIDKDNNYKKNILTFNMPKFILSASMKDIDSKDKNRLETIKWIKNFLDNYKGNIKNKGLYLTGNFGCGKTYLISALMNELAKNGAKIAMVYYPELLRKLKESFNDSDNFNNTLEKFKKVEILVIDDIGAETTTSWSRDEVLGTILQYRMEEELITFFTSNFKLDELEYHLSISSSGIEKVKARRIIERINQLTDNIVMISENKRK